MTQAEILEVAKEGAALFATTHNLSAYEENFLVSFIVKVIENSEGGVKLSYDEVMKLARQLPQFDAAKLSDVTLEIVTLYAKTYQIMLAGRHSW